MFVVVDGDKDYALVGEEAFGYAEAFGHKGDPFAVAVTILAIHIFVIIDKVFVAGVVGWVDIDDVDFALMGISEGGEGFEVVAFDKDVVWRVGGAAGDVAFSDFFEDWERGS